MPVITAAAVTVPRAPRHSFHIVGHAVPWLVRHCCVAGGDCAVHTDYPTAPRDL